MKKLNELKYEGGSGVSAAYLPQLALMCDAYTTYCQGLARSLSLLEDQSRHLGFMQFVQEPEVPEEELNITEFVEKPLLHLEELVYHINQLVAEMPRGDVDFANMRHVLSGKKNFTESSHKKIHRNFTDNSEKPHKPLIETTKIIHRNPRMLSLETLLNPSHPKHKTAF